MATRPKSFHPRNMSERERAADYERARGTAAARLYDARWDRARLVHLRRSALCRYCKLEGRIAAATVVDHLYPHRGDAALFWDERYWVSSCTPCHSGPKQAVEREGRAAIDALARRLGLQPLIGARG